MNQTADIVIAGAGVIGMCIAVQVARRSNARILVLDKAATPGEGSTGASSAVCRHKYSRSETVLLARDGIDAYRHWGDFVQLPNPLAQFSHSGMVWLGDGRPDWPAQEAQRLAGLGVRVEVLDDATRIQMVHIDRPEGVQGDLPVVCDPAGGIYFRTQNRGQQIIVGSVLESDELESVKNPDDYATYADDDYIRMKLYYLEHRLRGMGDIRRPRGYSGLYTINRVDYHPIVGPTPIDGFFVANGCSGHSFKLAPAIGSLIAQMLAGRADRFDTGVDPGYLAFDREPIKLDSHNVLA